MLGILKIILAKPQKILRSIIISILLIRQLRFLEVKCLTEEDNTVLLYVAKMGFENRPISKAFILLNTGPIVLNYILLIMLLQLSQLLLFCPPPPSTPHSLRQSPHQAIPTPLFMSMGHEYRFFGYSIPYTVPYIPVVIL